MKNIMITGGAGFIGSNFIRYIFEKTGFKGAVINYDKLTYAANLNNLIDIHRKFWGKRYFFVKGDICDYKTFLATMKKYDIDVVVNFAAESHVDRSIFGPKDFIDTNINGTFISLEACRKYWRDRKDVRFHHISTDEVYGSLGPEGYFYETTPYSPRSPYSASKASADHIVMAYFHTYGMPVTISNCSNNYGPYQFPEKLIPLIITNAFEGKDLPVYGDGKNIRDWIYVEDHCRAIWLILKKGKVGESYNVGGECEKENIEVVKNICLKLEKIYPSSNNPKLKGKKYIDLIKFVKDRPGHDRRYAINCDKIKNELGFKCYYDFDSAIDSTIKWYISNYKWVKEVKSGEYQKWISKNYKNRR
ncbi:MAG: dTDP-glucose 4,6-dehydratase [Elusimicrobiota bacterium]